MFRKLFRLTIKALNLLSWLVLFAVVVGWLDQGLKWYIAKYDPAFNKVLHAKLKNGYELSQMTEQVIAILRQHDENGHMVKETILDTDENK